MNVRLLLVLSTLAVAPAAQAQPGSSPLDPLFACRGITEDSARLACLDAAVETLYGETESGDVVAVDRERIEAAEEATFGLSIPNFSLPSLRRDHTELAEAVSTASPDRVVTRNDDGEIERVEGLHVVQLEISPAGNVYVTFDNGQVWRQTDDVRVQGARSGAREGLTGSIRSGALGSYFIQLSNGGRSFRAERVQ